MRWFKESVVVLLLALWVPVSLHCSLERLLPDQPWLQCCCADASDPSSPANCTQTPCGSVETGAFKAEEQMASPTPPAWSLLLVRSPEQELEPTAGCRPGMAGRPPLEWSRTWHFTRRAARQPRAPNLAA